MIGKPLTALPEGEKGPRTGCGLSFGRGKGPLILRETERVVFVFSYLD